MTVVPRGQVADQGQGMVDREGDDNLSAGDHCEEQVEAAPHGSGTLEADVN